MKAAYLLDTHTFIWSAIEPGKLSPKVKKLLVSQNVRLFLSVASLWEIAIKRSIGKLDLPIPTREFVNGAMTSIGAELVTISAGVALGVENLPPYHSDPFDRLLVSHATVMEISILSSDKKFDRYDVEREW